MPMNKEMLKDMVHTYLDMNDIEKRYQDFISKFRKVFSLYEIIHNKANEYVKNKLLTVGGNFPKLDEFYFDRIGGIK